MKDEIKKFKIPRSITSLTMGQVKCKITIKNWLIKNIIQNVILLLDNSKSMVYALSVATFVVT